MATDTGTYLVVTPLQRQMMSLAGPATLQTPMPAQLPTNRPRIAVNNHGDCGLIMSCFLTRVNLVSFLLGKLCVAHLGPSYFGRLEKATMLPQLAPLPTGKVALAN